MKTIPYIRLLPSMAMLTEEFETACWEIEFMDKDEKTYYGIRKYCGQSLQPDMIYLLDPAYADEFPTDKYAYISSAVIPGNAEHICCPGKSSDQILDFLLDIFDRCLYQETRINQLVYNDATLTDLCDLAEELVENPVCIHDDWFVLIAKSRLAETLIPPNRRGDSTLEFIPRQWVEEFKFDSDYLETYGHRDARLWISTPPIGTDRAIYVNLLDGNVYRGRFLIMEQNRRLRKADYRIAEVLTQQALLLLQRKQPGADSYHRGMDDVMYDLLHGRSIPASEEITLTNMLHWEPEDHLICVRIQSQEPDNTALLEHVLHSDLFNIFPTSYIMFTKMQQCIIINVTRTHYNISMIRHMISPLCGNFYQYAGISSPVSGLRELHIAYQQADVALQRAFRMRDEHWAIPFCDCSMDYLLTHMQPPFRLRHLVAPQLLDLMEYDKQKDTQYFDTLKVYLEHERNIPETSEVLIIHRTTLIYRLKKIQAITNLNLEDPEVRLYLLLSLRILGRDYD